MDGDHYEDDGGHKTPQFDRGQQRPVLGEQVVRPHPAHPDEGNERSRLHIEPLSGTDQRGRHDAQRRDGAGQGQDLPH